MKMHILSFYLNNKEFYSKFAKVAFDTVKYDMNIYNLMKSNFSEFCSTICHNMQEGDYSFESQIFTKMNNYDYKPSDAFPTTEMED